MIRQYKYLTIAFFSTISISLSIKADEKIEFVASNIAEERIKSSNDKIEENPNFLQTFTNLSATTDPNVFLNEIEVSPYSTRVKLTIAPTDPSGAYCLWDINDKSAYRLIDVDTNKAYLLEKQVSPINSCNKNEWYQLFRNETVQIQLFFPALGKDVKNVQLIEGVSGDEQTSAVFSVVQLERTPK